MPAADPWLWTTNDILAELRGSTTLPHAIDSAVEHYIREHQLTGAAFLTSFDVQPIDSIQRQSLSSVIDSLRRRSLTYQEQFTMKRVRLLDLNEMPTDRRSDSDDARSDEETSRKRRKVIHIHTTIPASSSGPAEVTANSNIEPVVEPTDAVKNSAWGHLLKWQEQDGDQEINWAELDEVGDELHTGHEEVGEENIEQEQQEEEVQDENVQSRSALSEEQILDIINERIEHYTNSWVLNKGVLKEDEVDYDVDQMWDDAEAQGRRPEYIAKHESNAAYYRQRLDRLCDEIHSSPANNATKLRQQCNNLEVTINSMQLEEWKASIYKLEPVSDSGQEPGSPGSGTRQTLAEPRLNTLQNQASSSIEIIDLGSPSEMSEDERTGGVVVEEHFEPALEVQEHIPISPHRPGTPDSVIMDTTEPPFQVRLERSTTTGSSMLSKSMANNGDEPENASIGSVRRWRWSHLVATQDRKRIVSKAVNEMKPDDREQMRLRLKQVGKAHIVKEIPACLDMLSNKGNKMPGVLPRDQPKIVLLTRLFLSWWLCDNYFREDPSQWHLEELRQCLEEDSPDPSTFCDYLSIIMSTTFSEEALRHPERPSQIEIIEISDDE